MDEKVDGRPKKRIVCKKIRNYFREYCNCSSIHGFRYFGERRTHFEKGWWFVVFSLTLSACIYMIWLVYKRWDETPVIVSFAITEKPLYTIPFPAVTICPETKIDKTRFNYTAESAKEWLYNSTLNDETRRTVFHFFNIVCDNEDEVDPDSFYIERETATNVLSILDPTRYPHPIKGCRYNGENIENCAEKFKPILTDEGICYTFNMLDRSELFKSDAEIPQHFFNTNISTKQWNIDTGYHKDADMFAEPRRALTSGVKNAFIIDLYTAENQTDRTCKTIQGYRVTLHVPMRIPRPSQQYFRVPFDQAVLGLINPYIIETSNGVKGFDPKKRECFFLNERNLAFFKIYSNLNCNIECLANFTLRMCNCVDFYMPRHKGTEICGIKKRPCVQQAAFFLKILDLNTKIHNSHNISLPVKDCNCRPICNDLSYNVETSQSPWDWSQKYKEYDKSADHMSRLILFFQNTQFVTHRRHELYGPTDFIANFGGLLGLFTGFSTLSFMELIYFLTLRLFFNVRIYGHWYGSET